VRSLPLIPPILAILLATEAAAQAQPRAEFGLAMTRLELGLDLDYQDGSLAGWARYEIINRSSEPAAEVPFNLGRLMTVQAARDPEGAALDFTQDVRTFDDSPRRQVNHVIVSLPRPLPPDSSVVLRLDYGGHLVGYTETGSRYIQDRVDESFSILREDAFAWPVLGTLSRRMNRSAPRPDFHFNARISVPERYTVASSGRLLEQTTKDGRTTFVYASSAPTPFLNIPVAEYALMSRPGVRVYYFPADSAGARRVLEGAARGLALLERWFGPLGTDPDIVVMEIPEMWGSQASLAGGIIQTADAFRDAGRLFALYHELTHLWNAPDVDQPSARWNEGLATFLSRRMARVLDGWEGMDEAVQRTAQHLVDPQASPPQIASVPFLDYGDHGLTDLSYRVGFLMFWALHAALGDERFDGGLGSYYQENRERGGTFEALMEHLEARTSTALDEFFRDWVRTTAWHDRLRSGTPPEAIGLR